MSFWSTSTHQNSLALAKCGQIHADHKHLPSSLTWPWGSCVFLCVLFLSAAIFSSFCASGRAVRCWYLIYTQRLICLWPPFLPFAWSLIFCTAVVVFCACFLSILFSMWKLLQYEVVLTLLFFFWTVLLFFVLFVIMCTCSQWEIFSSGDRLSNTYMY